jgi:hypothetical protein
MYNDYTRTFLKDCVDEIKVSGALEKVQSNCRKNFTNGKITNRKNLH